MTRKDDPPSAKRHARLTDARLAIKRAHDYKRRYPAATATPVVTDLRLALEGLLTELGEAVPR